MDIFVLPSLFEGLPVVCIEAQANGLRCLISDRVTRETDYTGLCEFLPLEKDMWAEKIIEQKGSAHAENMASHVERYGYDIQTEADKLMETYLAMAAYSQKAGEGV